MFIQKKLLRVASATVPLAALVATTVSGPAHAVNDQPKGRYLPGTISAVRTQFSYVANSESRYSRGYEDSYVGVRVSMAAGGGYDFTVDGEGVTPSDGCTNLDQVYVCTTSPGAPTIDFIGNRGGSDSISLYVEPYPAHPYFTVPVTVRTSGGKDSISLSGAVAKVNAGSGDDVVNVERGTTVTGPADLPATPGGDVQGGRGVDTVTYAEATNLTLRITLDGRANDGRPGEKDNIHRDVENLVGPDTGFTAVGSATANVLTGGRKGADHLVGRGGRDRLIGLGGNDRLDARDGRAGDAVSCGAGNDRVWLDRGDRMINPRACERVTYRR